MAIPKISRNASKIMVQVPLITINGSEMNGKVFKELADKLKITYWPTKLKH